MSRCILISASELSLFSVMVEWTYVFQSFSWLLLLSVSHVVTGNVHTMTRSVKMFGKSSFSQDCSAPSRVFGLWSKGDEEYLLFQRRNSVKSNWGEALYNSPTSVTEAGRYEAAMDWITPRSFTFVCWIGPNLSVNSVMIWSKNEEVSSVVCLWTLSCNVTAMNLPSNDLWSSNGNVHSRSLFHNTTGETPLCSWS